MIGRRTVSAAVRLFVSAFLIVTLLVTARGAGASGYDWPQFDGNAQHSGNNTLETAITAASVSQLQKVHTISLPSVADSSPVYLSGVTTANGTRDLLFITTKDGHILALDAHTGATVWSNGSGPGSCISSNGSVCITTSTPAVDPNRQYVYSYLLDGYVHKFRVGDGTEITGNGWPELATLKPTVEKSAGALTIATTPSGTYLYVVNGGYIGDAGDYQGHITAINLASGAQNVFNALCSNLAVHFVLNHNGGSDCNQATAAVWARPGVVYDSDTNKIYFSTGNGLYSPSSYDWGDSVLALNPDGTGSSTTPGYPVDSYTPADYSLLQQNDTDLGSTAPAILPSSAIPASSTYKHIGVQSGKDGELRLINLDNLSGQGGPGRTGGEIGADTNGDNDGDMDLPLTDEVLTQPAVWVNPADNSIWVFVANNAGMMGFKLVVNNGTPALQSVWSNSMTNRDSLGSSPLVADGVLFDARDNLVEALDPTTGHQLWHDTSIGGIHWEHPVVANGMLYITDESGNLNMYALPASATSTIRAGVVGTDSELFSWQPGIGFTPLGGALLAAPAVGLLPGSATQPSQALYVGLGTDHNLYVRSDSQGWQQLTTTPTYCIDNPALLLSGTVGNASITVACQGGDHGLWTASGSFTTGLPTVGAWTSLGGALKYGPAMAMVNGQVTYFAIGTDSFLYSRTASTGWTQMPWQCIGHPAVATSGTTSYLACHGLDGALYYATNSGSGWTAPRSAGGALIDGPGIAATASGATFFVEGTDQGLYQTSLPAGGTVTNGWTPDGGRIQYGAGGAGL